MFEKLKIKRALRKKTLGELEKLRGELIRKSPKSKQEQQKSQLIAKILEERWDEECLNLVLDLKQIGIKVKSPWDLVNTSIDYKEAIPVLIKHLPKPYHIKNKEGIIRALTVKEAKGIANKAIIKEYHKAPKDDSYYRWLFGNAMTQIITKDDVDDVIAIITNTSNGDSRSGFIEALGKIKTPKVKKVLQKLLDDPDKVIKKEVKEILKKFSKI